MPAARRKPAENRPLGGLFVEMERLRIEFGGKALDARRIHANAFRTAEFLAYGEILKIAHGRGTIRHGAATLKTARHEKTQHRLQRHQPGAAPPSATIDARGQACGAASEAVCMAASTASGRHRSPPVTRGRGMAPAAPRPPASPGRSDRAPPDLRGCRQ